MTEDKQTAKEPKGRKIIKNLLKTGLTIASPPVGLLSFVKKGNRLSREGFRTFSSGVLLSAGISMGIQIHCENIIYDKPTITMDRNPYSVPRNLFETFVSPIAFYLDTYPITIIDEYQELIDFKLDNAVYGHDVINFNSNEGKYELSFAEDRKFKNSDRDLVSVTEAKNEILELRARQDALIVDGDILGAGENLAELTEAKSRHEGIFGEYSAIKKVYEDAISKMNSELERLSTSNQ